MNQIRLLTKTPKTMIRTRPDLTSRNEIAFLDIDEIRYGRLVGSGGFCNVRSVRGFSVKNHSNDSTHHEYNHDERVMRNSIQVNCENGNLRYVIKTIKPERMESERSHLIAIGDLQMEASLLSRIRHPNIIRLRGISCEGGDAYNTPDRHDAYFLVLDRLKESLKDRILKWKLETNRLAQPSVLVSMLNHQRILNCKRQLFLERLNVAYDIASALEYLHSQRIIYRDLKSNNCGFDEDDKCLLFDFGLARPLPEATECMLDTFQLSGQAGTMCYMAPEVFRCEPYGTSTDTFSFAVLLWEILSLKTPFVHYTKQDYKYRVIKKGVRPTIGKAWPKEIQDLLESAWAADADERPTMKQVCEILRDTIDSVEDSFHQPRSQSRRTVSTEVNGVESSDEDSLAHSRSTSASTCSVWLFRRPR